MPTLEAQYGPRRIRAAGVPHCLQNEDKKVHFFFSVVSDQNPSGSITRREIKRGPADASEARKRSQAHCQTEV